MNRCSSNDAAAGCFPHGAIPHSRGPWDRRFMVTMGVPPTLKLSMNRCSSNDAAAGLRHSRGPWKSRVPKTFLVRPSAFFWFLANSRQGSCVHKGANMVYLDGFGHKLRSKRNYLPLILAVFAA